MFIERTFYIEKSGVQWFSMYWGYYIFFDKFSNFAIVNGYIYHKYNFGLLSEESNFHNFLINNYKNFSFESMYKIYTDIIKNRNMIICVSGNVDYIDFNVLSKYGNIEYI